MKNKFTYILLLFFIALQNTTVLSNTNSISDSLLLRIKSARNDTSKVNCLNDLAWELMYDKTDTTIILAKQALQIAEKNNWQKGIIKSNFQLGNSYDLNLNYFKALDCFLTAFNLSKMLKDSVNMMRSYKSIGIVYAELSKSDKAIDCYINALKIAEKLNKELFQAQTMVSIGNIFHEQKQHNKALDYYLKALEIFTKLNDKKSEMKVNSNIGVVYRILEQSNNALTHLKKALVYAQSIGDRYHESDFYMNIGNVYADDFHFEEARNYFRKAIAIKLKLKDKQGLAQNYYNMALVDYKTANYSDANNGFIKALAIDSTANAEESVLKDYMAIGNLMYDWGKYKQSSEFNKKALELKDSVFLNQKRNKINQRELEYEFEKKEFELKAENEKKRAISESERKRQQYIIGFSITLILLIGVFSIFIYKRFKTATKQNKIITEQKNTLNEKNKEIFDSISYAKRLQQAILPSEAYINSLFPNAFVLYLPKDIVAGDFYWAEQSKDKKLNLFGVADCTGHGVPGAMVSMVGVNALNRAVKTLNDSIPSAILDRLNKLIDSAFSKSTDNVQDGMDISLCAYDQEKSILYWAGANNPLWIVRKNNIIEYKADKQPIGKFETRKPFTNHTIQISKGDSIYLFSDGFADQFGGPNEKKFKYKQFQELLISISDNDVTSQAIALKNKFESWKGNIEQTDDVCVVGIQF